MAAVEAFAELDQISAALQRRTCMPDQVAQVLRELITCGKLAPGDRIVETRIARQLSIGQPTVREALKTLDDEGLVVRLPNRGCIVTKLSVAEINQVFRLRQEWESLAVRLAMERWSAAKAATIETASFSLSHAANERDLERFYKADLEFHRAIWHASGNPFLERALNQIVVPLFAFVMMKRLRGGSFDLNATAAGHAHLARLMASGDRENAVAFCRQVLGGFWEIVREIDADHAAAAP